MPLNRRTLLATAAALPGLRLTTAQAAEPILAGVSGPLTGPNAQYGAQWKRGFDLALDGINGAGGVAGRPLAYDFQDSQSDPRQSVAVAQKPGMAAGDRVLGQHDLIVAVPSDSHIACGERERAAGGEALQAQQLGRVGESQLRAAPDTRRREQSGEGGRQRGRQSRLFGDRLRGTLLRRVNRRL